MATELPIIKYANKLYFWNDKIKQIQNIEDPSDYLGFQDIDMAKIEEP